jgi:hypothetical protein
MIGAQTGARFAMHKTTLTIFVVASLGSVFSANDSPQAAEQEVERFDISEMQRYGVLANPIDLPEKPIDVYASDRAYWDSFHDQLRPSQGEHSGKRRAE